MATFLTARRVMSALGAVAALSLLTACNDGQGTASAPKTASGSGQQDFGDDSSTADTTTNTGAASTGTGASKGSGGTSVSGGGATSTRCTASQLRGNVSENKAGCRAGELPACRDQLLRPHVHHRRLPGRRLRGRLRQAAGTGPKRGSSSPPITLAPGKSAWAGLSFGNPEVGGTARPRPQGS